MAKSTNRKPSETDAAPVAQSSGGMSSFLVLTLITLVVVGCGVGYQKLLEEMESNNAKLVGTIVALKEELTSVKESYASINFENEIAAIGQMKEDLQATRLQSAGVAGEIESLKSSVTKLSTEAADEKAALVGKLSEAAAALEAHGGSVTERINAVESGLAAQISAATQQAVEAKQFAEESKKAAADARDVSATEMADGLELVKQNLAAILDARKNDEVKAGELAAQVAAVANGAVKASDVAGLSSQIAELQGSVAAVQKDVEEQGKNLQSAVKSFDSKANKLNANIKMNKQDVAGMREMVTNMVADNVDATEAPPSDEE